MSKPSNETLKARRHLLIKAMDKAGKLIQAYESLGAVDRGRFARRYPFLATGLELNSPTDNPVSAEEAS